MALARRFARLQLEEWGAPELCDSAALVVSELVTNAVVHTGTTAVLDLRLDANSLRIEVEDQHPGRALPHRRWSPRRTTPRGGGGCSSPRRWRRRGVSSTPRTSKRVWLVCDRDGARGTDPRRTRGRSHADRARHGGRRGRARRGRHGGDVEPGRDTAVRLGAGAGAGSALPPARWTRWPVRARPTGWTRRRVASGRASTRCWRPTARPVPVFASHADGSEATAPRVLLVPESQRGLLEHPAGRAASRAARRDSDPLGLRDDALLRLAVDDYLPLATERVRDALDADASYLLIGHEVDDVFEVVAVSGLPDSVRGTEVSAGDPGAPDARTPAPAGAAARRRGHPGAAAASGRPLRSLATVPVVAEGRVIGALTVASDRRDGFSDDQCVLLQRLADSLALATDRARLQTSERERRGWLTFVAEAGDLLAALAGPGDDDGHHRPDRGASAGHLVCAVPRRRAREARPAAGVARRRATRSTTCGSAGRDVGLDGLADSSDRWSQGR